MSDVISWAMPTPLWSLLHSTIVLYDTKNVPPFLITNSPIYICMHKMKPAIGLQVESITSDCFHIEIDQCNVDPQSPLIKTNKQKCDPV